MKNKLIYGAAVWIALALSAAAHDVGINPDSGFTDDLLRATVRIWTTQDGELAGTGSGTIIDQRDGHAKVLTCAHVVDECESIKVQIFDARNGFTRVIKNCPATTRYTNEGADIAILSFKCDEPLKIASIATKKRYNKKDDIIGAGCEFGADAVIRYGYIRGFETHNKIHPNIVTRVKTISGVSGGGLFNTKGELIGVRWGRQGYDTGLNAGLESVHKGLRAIKLNHLIERSVVK